MEWYRITSLQAGNIDVQADNWLSALALGLGKLGAVADLSRLACETLANGRILVRDVRTGVGYAVIPLAWDEAPDEPSEEVSKLDLDAITLISLGLEDYEAEVRSAPSAAEAILRALGGLRELAPCSAGTVLRRNTDGWLAFEGAFGPGSERLADVAIPPGTGVAGFSVDHRMAVSLRDAYSDPRFFRQLDSYTRSVTRSILCAPLLSGSEVYGCLELINATGADGFPSTAHADVEVICQALADRLALDPVPLPPTGR